MGTSFLELEITGQCQLECAHCYAASGPTGTHGAMTTADWRRVIDQAAGAGVGMVQFIGGEPTRHPALPELVERAIDADLEVEVFSNLVAVKDWWWELFASPLVSLATSYYSDRADEHDRVTGRPGSHARTRANIVEAARRGIPLRVGIIDVLDGQRVEAAHAEVEALGVTSVGTDRLRGVGRGAPATPTVRELCGHCGDSRAAVLPDGNVAPCVLSRWMTAGNVRETSLTEILSGPEMGSLIATIPSSRGPSVCNPEKTGCKPKQGDGGDCQPAEKQACRPDTGR